MRNSGFIYIIWLFLFMGMINISNTSGSAEIQEMNPVNNDSIRIMLDELIDRVEEDAAFSVSPRYIQLIPGEEFRILMKKIIAYRDKACIQITDRLKGKNPFETIVLLELLIEINTEESNRFVNRYIEEIKFSDPWHEKSPGRNEIILYLENKGFVKNINNNINH